MNSQDLGALFAKITSRLIDSERPLLREHGLSMWQYIVLAELDRKPAGTQLALAEAVGYDKTRLIGLLDDLEASGLIEREPDPIDRRARTVRLTPSGHQRHASARRDVRTMEHGFLAELTASEQATLRFVLPKLAEPRR